MGLSNTATPVYYAQFREEVMSGRLPVCEEISMEMNRVDALIADPNIYYDPEPTEGFIRYCENELTLTDGKPLRLLPSFKLWAESIFAWYYFQERSVPEPMPEDHPLGNGGWRYVQKQIKLRLVNKQYLIVARGAAKSLYESCLQSYFLNVDTTSTHQITTAPTMKQAEEIMGPIRTSVVRARGPYFKFLTEGSLQNTTGNRVLRQKLVPTKKGVENFLTNSLLEVRPMSIDKLQGLRTKMNTVDEWLSGDIREDVVTAIEQGASKIDDYLIVAVSSEGTVRNGVGDDIKMELLSILKGEYVNPHVSIWHYKLDNIKEVADQRMWIKANPNIGLTIAYETVERDVKKAENAPAARNEILAKRFGLPMEGYTYFFTYAQTLPHPRRPRRFNGMRCAMGADMSRGDDFCAFTFLFPLRRGDFGVHCRSYITELTLSRLPGAMRQKYEEFIQEGTLVIMPGNILDIEGTVFEDLDRHIMDNGFLVDAFGYDPYNAKGFVERWEKMNGPHGIEKVIQGARTESVPLGEIWNLADTRQLIFDQAIMQFCMGHCITIEDTNGNRKLMKRHSDEKIDNVSALVDALVAYKLFKEAFE